MIPYRFNHVYPRIVSYMQAEDARSARDPYHNYARMVRFPGVWGNAIGPTEWGSATRIIAYWLPKVDDPDRHEFFIMPRAAIADSISLRAISARIRREKRQAEKGKK